MVVQTLPNPEGHHWFKSYGHFTEGVDFAYWWSCIGKGLQSTGLPRLVSLVPQLQATAVIY